MFADIFQILTRLNKGPHVLQIITGIVLVHVAAILLYTAVAPYLGSLLAFAGFALYAAGARQPFFKPREAVIRKSSVFEA